MNSPFKIRFVKPSAGGAVVCGMGGAGGFAGLADLRLLSLSWWDILWIQELLVGSIALLVVLVIGTFGVMSRGVIYLYHCLVVHKARRKP